MKEQEDMREEIITATTELIQQSDGDASKITTRSIAQKANVGIGLINYHFQTKDKLIEICVQRIIHQVVYSFNPAKEYASDKDRLIGWASEVFEFLFENPSISRISILNDLANYIINCNSHNTQKGFLLALKEELSPQQKQLLVFTLTSTMQAAFLSQNTSKDFLEYDFNVGEDRTNFIAKLVTVLYDGIHHTKKDETL